MPWAAHKPVGPYESAANRYGVGHIRPKNGEREDSTVIVSGISEDLD